MSDDTTAGFTPDDTGLTPDDTAGAQPGTPTDRRPLGRWLRTVDALLTREFAVVLADEGVTRREWMLLNVLAGSVDAPELAERLSRHGKLARGLEKRGWAEERGDGSWTLTAEGLAAKERIGGLVDGIRARVAGAVSPEDFATTIASLEAIARALGGSEEMRVPEPCRERVGHRHDFGHPHRFEQRGRAGHQHDFAHRIGFEHHGHPREGEHQRHGTAHEHLCRGHRGKGGGAAERAYERGFTAGFTTGRQPEAPVR